VKHVTGEAGVRIEALASPVLFLRMSLIVLVVLWLVSCGALALLKESPLMAGKRAA